LDWHGAVDHRGVPELAVCVVAPTPQATVDNRTRVAATQADLLNAIRKPRDLDGSVTIDLGAIAKLPAIVPSPTPRTAIQNGAAMTTARRNCSRSVGEAVDLNR
jgi:hypothetical protein